MWLYDLKFRLSNMMYQSIYEIQTKYDCNLLVDDQLNNIEY